MDLHRFAGRDIVIEFRRFIEYGALDGNGVVSDGCIPIDDAAVVKTRHLLRDWSWSS